MANKSNRVVKKLPRLRILAAQIVWLVAMAALAVLPFGFDLEPRTLQVVAAIACVPAVITLMSLIQPVSGGRMGKAFAVFSWALLAGAVMLVSGGVTSAALVLFALAPLTALGFGERRLAVEAAAIALLALAGVMVLAVIETMPLPVPGQGLLDVTGGLAICGLIQLAVLIWAAVPLFGTGDNAQSDSDRTSRLSLPLLPTNSGSVVLDVSPEGQVRALSGGLPGLKGLATGHSLPQAVPFEAREEITALITTGGRLRLSLPDGRVADVVCQTREEGSRILMTDMTERMATFNNVRDLTLKQTADAKALRDRTLFFAGLSHELKTP